MKILEFIKNKKYLILLSLLFLFNLISIFRLYINRFSKSTFIIIFLIIFMVISIVSYILKVKKICFEKSFIVIYFIFGIFYICSFPMNSLPDEPNHFYRAHEISNGHLITDKNKKMDGKVFGETKVSPEVYDSISNNGNYDNFKDKLKIFYKKKSKLINLEITNVSMYSFVCYIPQATGILISKILHLPTVFWGYMARLFNFMVFCLFSYLAIKKIPFKKNSIIFILMLPITLQCAISMSADSITIASSLLLISYVLNLRNNSDEKITKKDLTILFLLSLIIALSKIVYLPICLFIYLIPKEKFKNIKHKYAILSMIFILVTFINFLWLSVASVYLNGITYRGVNSSEQLEFILSHPFVYAKVIIKTFLDFGFDLFKQVMSSTLGMFTIQISRVYVFINSILLLVLMIFDNEKVKVEKFLKLACLIIIGLIVGLICTSLYLDWTKVGNNIIEGIQGRYFIPIVILVILLFSNKKYIIEEKKLTKLLLIIMIMENIHALLCIINRF